MTAAERPTGYRHNLIIWQLDVSRTQVFGDPEQGRALVEILIRDNLDVGRPDRVRLVFTRTGTNRTAGEFSTQVLQHGVKARRAPVRKRSPWLRAVLVEAAQTVSLQPPAPAV